MAFDFYFAGTQNIKTQQLLCEMGANMLRSYVNDKNSIKQLIDAKSNGTWQGKLMIDSGAFTVHRKGGTVDVDAYIEFLNTNKNVVDYGIQLDHIPGVWGQVKTIEQLQEGPVKTWENYLYMVSKLERKEMLLPVFHQREDFKYLKQMVEYKYDNGNYIEYICLSGNKEMTSLQRKQWYLKCFDVIVRSANPNVKVHCLGSATFTDMEEYPFTSSDATSWLMTSSVGSILTPYGPVLVSEQQKHDKKHLNSMPIECINAVKELCDKYNIDYDQLPTDYMTRSNFNCHYCFEKSKETSYKPRNLRKGGLF